ncbi:HK97-gp10 family putative phage morphogenesis protein [Streptomyces anthocyanicus]|uniref:HK97-gp10 family putative phage morphogenesis protein n=1 Tax=Streptomyces anthocyanicus TaxID=68174 RepID=UPI00384E97F1
MSRKAEDKLRTGIARALERARNAVREQTETTAERVRSAAPVDTGALRGSVTVEQTAEGARLIVGDGAVDYAEFVERGTRHMSPRPFVGPSVSQMREEIVDAVQRAVSGGAKG